jgi:superfamily II DNA or RNA helicase
VIFDEVHRAKSHQRWDAEQSWEDEGKVKFSLKENQAAACLRLSKVARHRLGLTATPIRDRVRDLWAQLDLVRPGDFGGFWPWAKRYCAARESPFGGMDTRGSSNLAELQRRLGFVIHSVPHSLANRSLPPARRLVTFIPIAQQVRAEGSRNLIRGALKRGAAGLREALLMEAASRKRKIILDHVLDAIDGKLKIVIFTGRKIDVESIRAAISKKAPGCPLWAATGEDTPEQREVWRAEFMASPGPAVLVATGESFGEGLDLQDCDLGIMAMLPYTPGQVIQYEGRWVRLGMKRPVEIRYFVAEGTIDEHVSAILLEKLPAIERTVDLDEVRGLTSELAGDESELIASMAAKVLAA